MHEQNVELIKDRAGELELYVDLYGVEEPSELYAQQISLEKEMVDAAVLKFRESQERLVNSGSASDSHFYSKLREREVRHIVRDIELNYKYLLDEVRQKNEKADSDIKTSPSLIKLIQRYEGCIGFEVMAVLAFNQTINSLSFVNNTAPFEDTLITSIAEVIDHQAFMTYLNDLDPRLCQMIAKYKLDDQQLGRRKRIKGSITLANERNTNLNWEWMSPSDQRLLGKWLLDRVCYGTGLFETMPSFSPSSLTTRVVLMLTELGEKAVCDIEDEVCKRVGSSWVMVHPPRDWTRSTVGGYLTIQPGSRSHLVHNHAGTIVSDTAIDSLNRLQSVSWRVNPFILEVQKELLKTTNEIGSFRSFDAETYKLLNPLIENPATVELSWDEAKHDPELLKKKKKAYAIRKASEKDERNTANKAIATKRSIEMATRFLDVDRFYMPWYFDNRLRQYCLVDTLNPQGSDNVKALIMFSDGVAKSDSSYRDILISLATTFGNGLDKLPYEDRIEAAKRMIPFFEGVVNEPLAAKSVKLWQKADEPFQFLALLNEYYHVFIACDQDHHFVSSGRDATCSGIQIAGALLRDAKTCHLVNVTPSDSVQDAYKAVALEARKLLSNSVWLERRIQIREEARKKKAEKILAERLERKNKGLPDLGEYKYEPRYVCEVPLEQIDRGVAKMIVMLTPYGGSYQTMLRHVEEKLEKKGVQLHKADYTIVTHALIEGMAEALPGFSSLNKWFKELARRRLKAGNNQIVWVTPAGSTVKQEYLEEDEHTVKTFSFGETKVDRHISRKEKNAKRVKTSKMCSALAANTVHSLDASLLQLALHDYNGDCFTTVHDCVYGPSGILDQLVDRIKDAFYEVVSGDFLMDMLEENGLSEDDELVSQLRTMKHDDDGLLDSIKDSLYLFS
jgi:DNA-directed RNA polymerase